MSAELLAASTMSLTQCVCACVEARNFAAGFAFVVAGAAFVPRFRSQAQTTPSRPPE